MGPDGVKDVTEGVMTVCGVHFSHGYPFIVWWFLVAPSTRSQGWDPFAMFGGDGPTPGQGECIIHRNKAYKTVFHG